VLGHGAPVLLAHQGLGVGGSRGEHAQHRLPLVALDRVAHEHQLVVPKHLQQLSTNR
jgi:hypothetical protein